jgi:hypothetical protein
MKDIPFALTKQRKPDMTKSNQFTNSLLQASVLPHDEKAINALIRKRDRLCRRLFDAQVELIVKEYENMTGFRETGTDDDFTTYGDIDEAALEMLEEFVIFDLAERIKDMVATAEEEKALEDRRNGSTVVKPSV